MCFYDKLLNQKKLMAQHIIIALITIILLILIIIKSIKIIIVKAS